jgi:hypothetical protein
MVEGLGVHLIFSGGVKKKNTSSQVRLRASKQNVKSGAIATARRLSRSPGACAGSEDGFLQLARIDGGRRVGREGTGENILLLPLKKGEERVKMGERLGA